MTAHCWSRELEKLGPVYLAQIEGLSVQITALDQRMKKTAEKRLDRDIKIVEGNMMLTASKIRIITTLPLGLRIAIYAASMLTAPALVIAIKLFT